jgi:hypothetical protein
MLKKCRECRTLEQGGQRKGLGQGLNDRVPGQAVKDVGRSYRRREHDPDGKEPWIFAQDRENAIAPAPRQLQVEDEQVRYGPAKARQALQAIACRFDLEIVRGQQPGIDLTRFTSSVSEEYGRHPWSPSVRSAVGILGTLRESSLAFAPTASECRSQGWFKSEPSPATTRRLRLSRASLPHRASVPWSRRIDVEWRGSRHKGVRLGRLEKLPAI